MPGYLTRFLAALLGAARRVVTAIAECNAQQRRLTAARLSQQAGLFRPCQAPDTYDEFLLRTSGPLPHEPSARRRLAGHGVH